jgi:hypothetical protein
MLWHQLELERDEYTLSEIAKITKLDYRATLYREKIWLLMNKIIKPANMLGKYTIDFDNIAYILFEGTNLSILHSFAYQYIKPPRKIE